jgi:hypothetical protein
MGRDEKNHQRQIDAHDQERWCAFRHPAFAAVSDWQAPPMFQAIRPLTTSGLFDSFLNAHLARGWKPFDFGLQL